MLPTNSNPSLITHVATPTLIPEATRTDTGPTQATFGSSVRAAFAGIADSFPSMFSSARNSSRPDSSPGAAQTTPLTEEQRIAREQRMEQDKQETSRLMEEMITAHKQKGLSRTHAMTKCDLAYQENLLDFEPFRLPQQINGKKVAQNNLSATIIQSWARCNQAKQILNGLKAEKKSATIIQSWARGNQAKQILNGLKAGKQQAMNSLISRLDPLEIEGQSEASRLDSIERRSVNIGEQTNPSATTIEAAPLILPNVAHNDKLVDSQPRSLGQKLGAAAMVLGAGAAATYITSPEAKQLALQQAGVALRTVAQRAIPLIGAGWQSLAQRWAHLAPQFRPLIGAAWQSGQATFIRIAQGGMPVIGSGFRQARSGLTTLGNQGIVWIGSGLQASTEWIKNHTKK
jgi:hypothetical protein